jgi:hypothetical protein
MPQGSEIITAAPRLAEQGSRHVYRVKEPTRHAVNFFIVAVGGLFLSLTVLYLTRVLPYRGSLGGLLGADLIFAGIALFLGSGYNKRVILHADAIEVEGWFRSRKLSFADIRGRQTNASSMGAYGYAHIFVPRDDRKRKLAVPGSILRTDQFFRDWIKTIPKIPRR